MTKLTAVVVENETPVREAAGGALTAAGFGVTEAADTEAALRVLAADPAGIDVVVTNVDMQGPLSGLRLARTVNARWPWIKLLMTSGRSTPRSPELPAGIGFMRKPYDLKLMALRVRELIFPRRRS